MVKDASSRFCITAGSVTDNLHPALQEVNDREQDEEEYR
jgi:hypothetical protein